MAAATATAAATSASGTGTPAAPANESTASGWGKWVYLAGVGVMGLLMLKFCGGQKQTALVAPPAATVASGVVSQTAPVALGNWQASVRQGQVVLAGQMPSEAGKNQLLAAARQIFGDTGVMDQLQVDASLPAFEVGDKALHSVLAWLQQHPDATLQAAHQRLAVGGRLGEALLAGLPQQFAAWLGDSVVVDASGVQPQLMKAADAFRQGIKDFRINVEFDTGKATLRAASRTELDELAAVLKEAGVAGEVAGHTDNVGQPQANLDLSQQRAQAVKDYLVQQGVAADKLTATGYGMTQPIADNASAEGRQRNRRVQFRVM